MPPARLVEDAAETVERPAVVGKLLQVLAVGFLVFLEPSVHQVDRAEGVADRLQVVRRLAAVAELVLGDLRALQVLGGLAQLTFLQGDLRSNNSKRNLQIQIDDFHSS